MKAQITPEGIKIQTFMEIYNSLAKEMKDIYGSDINLEQNTPDGQLISIITKMIADLQETLADLYAQLDPDAARGTMLNKLIKFCGITRKQATKSIVDIIIKTDRKVTLPPNYIVEDETGQKWVTDSENILDTGDNVITLKSEFAGKYEAAANTINKPITIILGIKAVTNPEPAIAGKDEETDQELRLRRNLSLENGGYSTTASLYSALYNLDEVSEVVIYENNTNVYDERGIPPHTYWTIIDGGISNEIVKTIALEKTGGTGLKGKINGIYEETTEHGKILHSIKYDRPIKTPIFIRLTVKRKNSTMPADIMSIKKRLSRQSFKISEDAVVTNLYSIIYKGDPKIIATNLSVSKDKENYTKDLLKADLDEVFFIPEENIFVTEVI